MHKKIISILTFLIVCILIFTSTLAEENKNVNDIRKEQEEVRKQIDDASNKVEDVKEQISENLQRISQLDERISEFNLEIEELENKSKRLEKAINKVESKFKIIEEDYKKQKEQVDSRLIAMYETNDTKYLDVLLQSKGITDFISNYYLLTEIAEHDIEMLQDINLQKSQVEETKNKLKRGKEELKKQKREKDKNSIILTNSKIMREVMLKTLTKEEQILNEKLQEYNSQYDKINMEILELQGIDSEYIGGELAWPVPGYTRISSKYGMRYHPILHVNKIHTGVDISAPAGEKFISVNDGIVTKASYNGAYGNMVIVDHGGGVSTLYAHGSEILVQVGDIVKRGEPVLKIGSTGYSTGPHAHFEVRIDGRHTDPLPYITNGLVPNKEEKTNKNQKENEEKDNQEKLKE